jgi:mRNA degradation ribonuclease J1/J2
LQKYQLLEKKLFMSKIKIAALGGVREFGKNMYVVEVDDVIFVLMQA